MSNRFLLDSWAFLAYLNLEEPAASRVKELLEAAKNGKAQLSISLINLGEDTTRYAHHEGMKIGNEFSPINANSC